MKNETGKRAVAIVGRPNVGKSSIFNRLGKRMAIVHAERGVTRDRVEQEAEWAGRRVTLIDTGGLGALDDERDREEAGVLEPLVKQQIRAAIEDAGVIIMVADVEAGLTPQDEEAAQFLRLSGKPVLLAANKADNPARDDGASDFFGLGFPVFPVSALHFRGFGPLMDAVLERLPEGEDAGQHTPLRIAIVGHPNVGKSSFVNRLLGFERMIVSDLPGTTRDSVDTPFSAGDGAGARHYVLTDTAGMRYRRKTRKAVDRFSLASAERGIERSDVAALLLDAAQGPTAYDKKIASIILDRRKACVILVNKWDLNRGSSSSRYLDALRNVFPFLDFVPVLSVSAKTGFNVKQALKAIEAVAANSSARLSTGVLNRTVQRACRKQQPPLISGKRLKIYYATQVGTRPITIMLFVNPGGRMEQTYETYMANTVRREFGLDGIPIVFKLAQKRAAGKKDKKNLGIHNR